MKSGANFEDQNAIKRFMEAGYDDPSVIGHKIGVHPDVVDRFMTAFLADFEEVVEDDDPETDPKDLDPNDPNPPTQE